MIKYKGWTITFNQKPIPDRRWDYDAVHDEYDGTNDLFFSCGSIEEAKEEIDDMSHIISED